MENHNIPNIEPITIFLVLRTGGDVYTSRYVNTTANNIRNHVTSKHEIVCITDNITGINSIDRVIKMKHNWPKWWGKVELFRDDVTQNSHCLFMDLDTVCVGNIDYLCSPNIGFFGLRDFNQASIFQTGVMKWNVSSSVHRIYHGFTMGNRTRYMNGGDHEWIGASAPDKKFLQDAFPGEICSYKKHLPHIYKKIINPSIVCFHGNPRPHTVKDAFITSVWKY